MSRAADGSQTALLAEEVEGPSEAQLDNDDLGYFLDSNGLTHASDVWFKAAALLRGDDQSVTLDNDEDDALSRETSHKWSQPKLLYFTIFVCALGAIEQGWAQTGTNGANLYLPKALDIDPKTDQGALILGLINCGIFVGQIAGAWLSSPLNNSFGRRGAVCVATLICFIGNVGSAISTTWQWLIGFRLILGTGLGLNSSTLNVFAAESAPPSIRGGLGVTWQMFTAFGIFLGFLANVAFYDLSADFTWRLQLAAPIVPTIPLLLCIYVCPESATWFMKQERYGSAFDSLQRLRNTSLQAAMEVYSAYLVNKISRKLTITDTSFASSVKALFSTPRNRNAVYASYTTQFAQQICGINIIAFYSSTIFSSSGFTALQALWASVIFGAVNAFGALPAIWTMDTLGRRKLLLWTLPPMAATMLLASLSFTLPEGTGRLIALAAMVYLFCLLYSPGMGPIPCAYSAEVFPASVREVGMGLAISTASFWATVLSLTFPSLLSHLGEQESFGLYAGLNVVAWLLCFVFVREVKGKALEELDDVFEESVWDYTKREVRGVLEGVTLMPRPQRGWIAVEQEDVA